METFKELVETLINISIKSRPNSKLKEELHHFMESEMKLFKVKSGHPSKMILASITLPKFYPTVAETFTELLLMNEDIDMEKERLLYDQSNSLES